MTNPVHPTIAAALAPFAPAAKPDAKRIAEEIFAQIEMRSGFPIDMLAEVMPASASFTFVFAATDLGMSKLEIVEHSGPLRSNVESCLRFFDERAAAREIAERVRAELKL